MTNAELVAYHGNPALKASVLAEMAEHRAADVLVQGVYWENGRGCAVGCLTNDPAGGHAQYPVRWGIPEKLAWLEDGIFENLPLEDALVWPERFLAAIEPGADLSGVYAEWASELFEWKPEYSKEEHWRLEADRLIACLTKAPVVVVS
jgi:hypothetical protein